MPFIQYAIGDRGSICAGNSCKCGNKNAILRLSSGRANDYISFRDGTATSSYALVQIIDRVNELIDGAILQFYFEQTVFSDSKF